jgi:hypothetical protein
MAGTWRSFQHKQSGPQACFSLRISSATHLIPTWALRNAFSGPLDVGLFDSQSWESFLGLGGPAEHQPQVARGVLGQRLARARGARVLIPRCAFSSCAAEVWIDLHLPRFQQPFRDVAVIFVLCVPGPQLNRTDTGLVREAQLL